MNLLKLLKEKADYFTTSDEDRGIANVVSHIEVAERHYTKGKAGEDFLFNDVIYRSNQAFEGALKEAHRIIYGKDKSKVKIFDIESDFEKDNVLKDRVLELFRNYRQKWRNESTHNYQLYFSEQEAFLAIVNISAFVNILFDEMLEKRAFNKEVSEIEAGKTIDFEFKKEYSLLEKSIFLLENFSLQVPEKTRGVAVPKISEAELRGYLLAYIQNSAPSIKVYPDYVITTSAIKHRMYVDLLLEDNREKLIIEIKSATKNTTGTVFNGTDQLLSYMVASNIKQGILYIPTLRDTEKLEMTEVTRQIGDKEYKVIQLLPRRKRK